MVIAKGKVFQNVTGLIRTQAFQMDWVIAHSETGWSNDRLGYIWLTEVFDPYTKQHTKGTKRLLIMDGHSSHCSEPFETYARKNNIIPLWLPLTFLGYSATIRCCLLQFGQEALSSRGRDVGS